MSEPFSLSYIGERLVGVMVSVGSDKVLDLIKEKLLVRRAIKDAASRCGGYVPGGERRVEEYLREWVSSPEFERFLHALSQGNDLNEVLERGLDSFLKRSGFTKLDSQTTREWAERIIGEFLQALQNEVYGASGGRAAMMRRLEQMHAEKLDEFGGGFAQIQNSLSGLKAPAREAVNSYLAKSHEWQPLKKLIEEGALPEAANALKERLEEVDQLLSEHPEVESFFRDHRQDLLLKMALVLSQQGYSEKAARYYDQAKALGFESPERRQQALTVLLNLQRVDEYEAVLEQGEVSKPDKAEMELLVLKGRWAEVAERIDPEAEDFRPLYLSVLAELERDDNVSLHAAELDARLDRAAELIGKHPVKKGQLAIATNRLLLRVVNDMLEAPGLDRAKLVETARTRTQEALDIYASTEADNTFFVVLRSAYLLYALMQDGERRREIEGQYENTAGEASPVEEWDEALSKGRISQAHHLFLTAGALLDNPAGAQKDKAISLLQSALHLAEESKLRLAVAQRLVETHLQEDNPEDAEQVLGQIPEAPAHEIPLLRAPIIHARDGRSAAIDYLSEAVERFPRHLPLRRALVELIITEIKHRAEEGASPSDLEALVQDVEMHVESMQKVLPVPTHIIAAARAHFAAQDFNGVLEQLDPVVADPESPVEAGMMRVKALEALRRYNEAGEHMAELAERTSNPIHATNAAAYWLEAHEHERAIAFLDPWVDSHSDDPFLAANLASALIMARSEDSAAGRRAFNLLARACRQRSELQNINLLMARAASIAGKEEVARRYFRQALPAGPAVRIREKEDFYALHEATEDGFALFRFEGDEGVHAFVEWQQEYIQNLNQLLAAELISYGDLFNRNGRPWTHWAQWTQAAAEQFKRHREVTAVKAPWPTVTRISEDRRGLLLDITALLTLSVLSETGSLLRALDAAGLHPHIRASDFSTLSSAVAAPVDHLFSSEELPYEKLADTLRSHDLLPTFEAEEVERYRKASPEELQEHFGNNAYDFGLACELDEAVFVSDRQATLDYEPEAHEPTVITSASLLRALVKEGIVGKEAADRAAAINDRFDEWRDAPIVEVPSRVVISAFALPYWFQTGLLTSFDEGWLRGEPGWPRLHVGPFARKHLLEQAREQRIKNMKIDAAARLYAVLHRLIANGVVTVLPDEDTISETDGHRLHLRKLWPRALSSLHLAQRYNLNVWSDDRVIGYLLWPFGHPLPIPEITQEGRMIRQNHSEVHLRTTEDLLEILRDEGHLQEHLAEELGYELLRYGYRPLRFRLALLHLFRDFAYKTGSPRYEPLLQALRMLVSDPEPSTDDEAGPFPGIDPEPLERLVLITIIPDLIATVWFAPVHRTNEERQALADDLLSLATEQLEARGEELGDGPASFWVTLLGQLVVHSFDANSQQDEKNTASRRAEPMSTSEEQSDTSAEDVSDIQLQEALDWFTDVLVRHEKGERRQLVVRGIEDYLVDLLRSQAKSFLSDMPDICSEGEAEGNQTRIELRSRATAAIIERLQPYLYPLFNSELLNDVDPLFRRALGVLACAEGRYKTQHLVPVAGGDYKLKVEEEEEEQFALQLVLDAMQGDWDAARMVKADLTVDCVWNRPVPEEQRIDQPDFPEQHQVPVKISLVSLLLRNDVYNYPNLAEVVLSQLQLIDPSFGQELLRLRVDLLSDDEDIRRSGRERLAFALLRSPFFELQRDLAHGIRQLRKMDTEHFENFLAPQEGWFDEENNTATVAVNGREHPIAMTTDLTVLCANPGTLYEAAKREAELILQQHEDDDLERRLAVLAKTMCEICSPFQASYLLLTALIIAARLDKQASFAFGSQERTLGDWISSYLQHVLNASLDSASSEMDYDRSAIRPPHLKVVHACILRLTANVAGSPSHIQTWQKELEDDEEVLCQWAHATLAFAARLLPLLIGRYGTDVLLKEAIEEAVHSLNIAYDDPIEFPDRFNPFLLGPHLLDHEVAAVFYVLTVFISHNQEAASVLDLEALRVSANQWISEERSEAEQIYEAQQERAYNALNLQVPLSQQVAASRLLGVLGRV